MKLGPLFFALTALCGASVAQRPATEADALRAFNKVKSQPERMRHGAVRDLGRFSGEDASRELLYQLDQAESMSYLFAVVRAIGSSARKDAVGPLLARLQAIDGPRLSEAIAEALRRQGDPGIDALANELPRCREHRPRRQAICYALARVTDHLGARDMLLDEIKTVGGGAQLLPLQGLAARKDDAVVDQVRVKLAGGKNTLVAGTAVQQLADHKHADAAKAAKLLGRRLSSDARGDIFRAVVSGLLCSPEEAGEMMLWRAASLADRPFEQQLAAAWTAALAADAVFASLKKDACNAKDAAIRSTAARALAMVAPEQQAPAKMVLASLLIDKELDVVRNACWSAALLSAGDELRTALLAGSPAHQAMRITALFHIGRLADEDVAALDEAGPRLKGEARAAWLRGLAADAGGLASGRGELACKHINDKDWRTRAAAFELAVAAPTKGAVTALIARLKREKGRLQQDVVAALQKITGAGFVSHKQWLSWWKREQDSIQLPLTSEPASPHEAPAGTTAYWDMPVYSTRVAFVVDTSGSMEKPFGRANNTRLEQAQEQLGAVLARLPKGSKVNVVGFAAKAEQMFAKLGQLNSRQKKVADAYVAALGAKGPTNVYGGLEAAFQDSAVDSIFLLTDGRPSSGAIAAPEALALMAKLWNAGRMVRIHTIALGEDSDLLKRLAGSSGGVYRVAR